ncbi:MAG: glycosyltransferase family 2 protein, partial [Actinomycetia bacterium]|nr:glycosyltransferase family 2 protein [Actinomycetes bacterium]
MAATDDKPSRADEIDATRPTGSPVAAAASRDATPSVTAVVVAHEPGEWFSETLDSIVTQDYPRLGLLVIDAAGDSLLAERVKAVAPGATIVDAGDTTGFAAAANAALDTGIDPAFMLVCHDDVALEPDVVRILVTESLRSNAGITGPKLVEWDRPEQLQHVGFVVDRFAVAADVVEQAELDQEQYDAVTDVFAVPSACLLIRTGLFETLRGFDPAIDRRGDDVDLCWRAQLVGARVLVAPDAMVRHRENMVERTGVDDIRRTRARHQLRTVLVTGGVLSLLVTLPALMLLSIGEALLALVTGRFSHVGDVVGAWTWNLRRIGGVRRRRRRMAEISRVRQADIRALQQSGSVRINAFIRGQIGRGERRFGREIVSAMRTGTTRFALIAWAIVVLFVLFGSRALITDGVPAVGDFAAFPESSTELIGDWWSGWHDRDLGSPGVVPTGFGLLGLLATVLGGTVGLVRTLWVLGPVFVGLIGAWRVLAVTGSRRGQIGSLV